MEFHWSQCYWMEHQWIQCYIERYFTEVNANNWTSVNSMIDWKEFHWSQCYQMQHQWIQCCIESFHWVKSYMKWNISEFNDIMNGISLQSMFLNETSVTSIKYSMESHWSQWIQCYNGSSHWVKWYIEWNSTEVNVVLEGIWLKSMLLIGTPVNLML